MTNWIRAASVAQLRSAGGLLGCTVDGVEIALYEVDGEYFATSNLCTHAHAFLSEGWLEGHLIECPIHQGLFDIRTGEVKGPPCTEPIQTYPVKKQDEELLVAVAPAAGAGPTVASRE